MPFKYVTYIELERLNTSANPNSNLQEGDIIKEVNREVVYNSLIALTYLNFLFLNKYIFC